MSLILFVAGVTYLYFRHVTGLVKLIVFFFFKQKTAYEIMPSLVGSEMCIRDRCNRQKQYRKALWTKHKRECWHK